MANNNCTIEAAKLNKSLLDAAVAAQRAKLGSAVLKMIGVDVGVDSLSDAVLAQIDLQVKTFSTDCNAYAALAENICLESCQKLSWVMPLLVLARRRNDDEDEG
jgi:hypothetical protein